VQQQLPVEDSESATSPSTLNGPKANNPALLYLLIYPKFLAIRIGVTTKHSSPNQINEEQQNGWTVLKTWKFEITSAAEELESHVLARWETELNTENVTSAEEVFSSGESRTVSMREANVKETLDFIDRSIEFYFTHHVPN
tara:strand:+ start:219 stop:641 length:423 start_codon:yes stop_codon:yes gene_type:complete